MSDEHTKSKTGPKRTTPGHEHEAASSTRVLHDLYDQEHVAWQAWPKAVKVRQTMLARHLDKGANTKGVLLDLGCGPGNMGQSVTKTFPNLTRIGLDWSTSMLARNQTLNDAGVQGLLDPAELPFRTNSVAAVMLAEVIEHLVDPDKLADEIMRVLKPGGAVIVTTPNLAAWFNRLLLAAGQQPLFSEVSTRKIYGRMGSEVVGHMRLYTKKALEGMFEDLGFENVETMGVPHTRAPYGSRTLDEMLSKRAGLAAGLVLGANKPVNWRTHDKLMKLEPRVLRK